MKAAEKLITLKNGSTAILKSPCEEDAEGLLHCIRTACGETEFLVRYPEEWDIGVEKEAEWIRRMLAAPDALAISCYLDGRVVGNCDITFRSGIKTRHRAVVSIAILRECWSLGIGSAMFRELIAAAKERGTEILELEFAEGNERAQRLYEKFGFRIVSEKPNALRLKNGRMLKEFYMQKYL